MRPTRGLGLAFVATLVSALTLGACGGGSGEQRDAAHDVIAQADAGPDDVGPPPCTAEGFTVVDETAEATATDFYYQGYSSATDPADIITVELYYGLGGVEPLQGPGSVTIGAADSDTNYATCSTCVLVWTGCTGDECTGPTYFATEGTLEISALATGGSFTGTLTDARLVEVEIDQRTYLSTPVDEGGTWCVASVSFDAAVAGALPCGSSEECAPAAATPYCNLDTSACVQCLDGAHCAALGATPYCDPTSFACVECVTNDHCAGNANGHLCGGGWCGTCATSFDCTSAGAPVCQPDPTSGRPGCGVGGTCAGDDAGEPGDDGPAGARDLTVGVALSGAVCDAELESDYYQVTTAAAGSLTFTLAFTITDAAAPEDLDLVVMDATGAELGSAETTASTETVTLTGQPAGTYYAAVYAYSMGPATDAIPYTITVTTP